MVIYLHAHTPKDVKGLQIYNIQFLPGVSVLLSGAAQSMGDQVSAWASTDVVLGDSELLKNEQPTSCINQNTRLCVTPRGVVQGIPHSHFSIHLDLLLCGKRATLFSAFVDQ